MADPTPLRRDKMLQQLERDIAPYAPKPEPVEEKDIGRLSAEAVLAQFDIASKSVESLGEEIRERIIKLETALKEADSDLKLITEASLAIREKGKLVHIQIQEAAQLSKEIRDTCSDFRKKVSTTSTITPEDKLQ